MKRFSVLCVITLLLPNSVIALEPLFEVPVHFAAGEGPVSVFCTDLNGDSYPDLAVANYWSDNVSIMFNNGDGTFQAADNYTVGTRPTSVFACDLDSDNDNDLAVANRASSNVLVLLNNGSGSFAATVYYVVGNDPHSVYGSDLDGDGDVDLAVAGFSNNVSILLNNGDATFDPPVDYAAGDGSLSVFCSDLDGDGDGDLAVANKGSDDVSILLNNGNGTFQPAVNYALDLDPFSVFCNDLDGDNDYDLVVAVMGSWPFPGPPGHVSILLNNGNGTFQPATEYSAGTNPRSAFCCDLDGDNDIDVAVASFTSDNASILLNNNDGTFLTASSYEAGSGPNSIFCCDLDGDDDMDLAVANEYSDNVSILLNLTNEPGALSVTLDIKPGSCPNLLNGIGRNKGKAVLPVAILGTDDLDVHEIDPETVVLEGVSPLRWSYEDVSTPVDKDNDSCACTEDGPDVYEDLTLKFDRQAIIECLMPVQVNGDNAGSAHELTITGAYVKNQPEHPRAPWRNTYVLHMTGELYDGTPIAGYDCVLLITREEPSPVSVAPRPLELLGNHPNPFNPVTQISLYLPQAVHVTIDIYNVLGQRVDRLVDDVMDAGEHVVEWDGSKAASGVYFYRFQAGDYVETKKMLLLK